MLQRKVRERLVRILFLTFDSITGIGGTKTEMESVVRKWNSRGKRRERREREQCIWPQKRESHVCD